MSRFGQPDLWCVAVIGSETKNRGGTEFFTDYGRAREYAVSHTRPEEEWVIYRLEEEARTRCTVDVEFTRDRGKADMTGDAP